MNGFKTFFKEMPMALNAPMGWGNLPQGKSGVQLGFDDKSHKMFSNEKARNKIVKRMSNVPHDFNVYIVPTKQRVHSNYYPVNFKDYIYKQLDITEDQAPIIPDKINCFITSWELEPPTTWMIMHRFAHAHGEMMFAVREILQNGGTELGLNRNGYAAFNLVQRYGTMKSARNGDLGAGDEAVHEVIAQYLMQGKVKFQRQSYDEFNPTRGFDVLTKIEQNVNATIAKYMEEAKKYIYVLF